MRCDHDALERDILAAWDREATFTVSVRNRVVGVPFVIYEGPPTANGLPGLHHVMARTLKDAVARYKTMCGYRVERRAGWDEHGLPVEISVQKELDLLTKEDVVRYGIEKFNSACAASVRASVAEWEVTSRRMGYWLDFQNAYHTSSDEFVASVWHAIQELHFNGLIYRDSKVVPWACDSGTAVSNNEVAQGYREVTHQSAQVMFNSPPFKLLAWTTTPWTLPANAALAVNPDIEYKIFQVGKHQVICLDAPGKFIGSIKGASLVGREYESPYGGVRKVVSADFVTREGTGIVHIAPAFGEEDYAVGVKENLEVIRHVEPNGVFNSRSPDFLVGRNLMIDDFQKANGLVIADLRKREILYDTKPHKHQYPHNWRTGKPLIHYLRPCWYVRMDGLREGMERANQQINWYPGHVKDGRFGAWLKGKVDWCISRERFWGTPLPLYVGKNDNVFATALPPASHRPEADDPSDINIKVNGEAWSRVPEVLDCWFDSGCVPFAAYDSRPADLVCEGVDQTRGWFYSMLALGVALKGESPFKAAICTGHVLAEDGHKMSKSKGNAVDPMQMFRRYGADAVRWHMARVPVGSDLFFKEQELRSSSFLNRLWNCFEFCKSHPTDRQDGATLLDRWIDIRLAKTVAGVTEAYDHYAFHEVTALIEQFVDDLSNVWIRSGREWFPTGNRRLRRCLMVVCLLAAPLIPFLADHIYRHFNGESVHLANWPKANSEVDGEGVLNAVAHARDIISTGRRRREERGIKLRQPLGLAYVPTNVDEGLLGFIRQELNVWDIQKLPVLEVEMDYTLTKELLDDGLTREFSRVVQAFRRRLGLRAGERVILSVDCPTEMKFRLGSLSKLSVIWKDGGAKDCRWNEAAQVEEYKVRIGINSKPNGDSHEAA